MKYAIGLVLGLGAAGCDDAGSSTVDDPVETDAADTDSTTATDDTEAAVDEGVTYHGDVRALIDQHCIGCHSPGGVGPVDFTYKAEDWDGRKPAWAFAAVAAVQSGAMPPWPYNDDCHEVEGKRSLSPEIIAVFDDWADEGFEVGAASSYVAPPATSFQALRPPGVGEPQIVLRSAEAHKASTENPDEYRCFILDLPTDKDRWIRGIEMLPDETEVVHHAIVYQYLPAQAAEIAELRQKDIDDEGPGYSCWGNPSADTVLAWAPGQTGEFMPADVGRLAAKGAVWVLQIHYNTLGRDAEDIRGDRTAVNLWTWPDGQKPRMARLNIPIPKGDLNIPSGDPNVVETEEIDLSWLGTVSALAPELAVVGVMGHMHQLGTSISLKFKYPSREECLLDVPEWDFGWQMSYFFPEAEWVRPSSGAVLELTCTYDNSAANQITVNGEQLEPRDVHWGEGTRDEMCLAYLQIQVPRSVLDLLLGLL